MSSEASATRALVWLVAGVDLCVSLEIVLADEALSAAVALELAVTKMRLNVGANVFSSAEHLAAILVETCPLVGGGVLLADVPLDFFGSNARVLKAGINLEVVEKRGLLEVG